MLLSILLIPMTNNASISSSLVYLTLGLYVDDFVYSSTNNAMEGGNHCIMPNLINVDFMRTVELLLGFHFSW